MGKPGGRIPKLDKTAHDVIVKAVSDGVPRRFAASLAGVTERTLARWLARGRKDASGIFWQFCQDIKGAEAAFIQRNVKEIEAAGLDSWQARAWLLERKFPEEFSLQRQEIAALKKDLAALLKRLGEQNGAGDPGAAAAGAAGE